MSGPINPTTFSESLLYAVTRITAQAGGSPTQFGTGFYYAEDIDDGREVTLLVTNRHVIDGADSILIDYHIAEPVGDSFKPSGRFFTYNIVLDRPHLVFPDDPTIDLVGIPISGAIEDAKTNGRPFFWRNVGPELVPNDSEWEDFDAVEDVLMVGCPNGIFDNTNKIPIIRKGITASPIAITYEGRPEFMIDAACFGGSSGSPVFVFNQMGWVNKGVNAVQMGSSRLKFVGVLYAGPTFEQSGNIIMARTPVAKITSMLHLGLVVRSSEVRQLMSKALNAARKLVISA